MKTSTHETAKSDNYTFPSNLLIYLKSKPSLDYNVQILKLIIRIKIINITYQRLSSAILLTVAANELFVYFFDFFELTF